MRSRRRLLLDLERWWEPVMVALGFVWLALLIVELSGGANPWLERISQGIWIVFIGDFLLRLLLAPRRLRYLRRNVLTLIALAIPALRAEIRSLREERGSSSRE